MKHDFLTRMREIFAHFLSKLNEDTCHYINGPETLPPPLTKAEEQVIFQNIRDGKPNARDPLITHNLRLVVYIAKKFESPAVNVEDLISIGTIGLIKAVNTFSVERNIKLATYASAYNTHGTHIVKLRLSTRRVPVSSTISSAVFGTVISTSHVSFAPSETALNAQRLWLRTANFDSLSRT